MPSLVNETVIGVPAKDVSRALEFYNEIFKGYSEFVLLQGYPKYVLPHNRANKNVVIVHHIKIVFTVEDIFIILDESIPIHIIINRIKKAGGQVILPPYFNEKIKTWASVFIDCESNEITLCSTKN